MKESTSEVGGEVLIVVCTDIVVGWEVVGVRQ